MYIVFLIILGAIFVFVPILDATGILDGKADPKTDPSEIRCKNYYITTTFLWCLVTPIIIMGIIGDISLADVGFRPLNFHHNIWFTVTAITLALALFVREFALPLIRIDKYRKEIAMDEDDDINEYPHTFKEKLLYTIQSLSSAICEETVYRGFLIFLLYAVFPEIPILLICLIVFIAFGIGHLYQGLRNAIEIGLFGVLSICLTIVTGSLIPAILLHFFGEFASTFMVKKNDCR